MKIVKIKKKMKFVSDFIVSVNELNLLLDNKENFYLSLLAQGWYLPNFKSRCITFEYL